jgi:hypothetical protein
MPFITPLTDATDLMWPLNLLAGITQSAFGVFLPLIVQQLGYTSYMANLYSVPIYVVGAVGKSTLDINTMLPCN